MPPTIARTSENARLVCLSGATVAPRSVTTEHQAALESVKRHFHRAPQPYVSDRPQPSLTIVISVAA